MRHRAFIMWLLCCPLVLAAELKTDQPVSPAVGPPSNAKGDPFAANVAELRETGRKHRAEFFGNEVGKPLVRGPIQKNWRKRGDFTRKYVQSILLFAMRCCELNEQLDEANAALREMCQYHLDRPQTFFEVHSFPGAVTILARVYVFFGPQGAKAAGRLSAETCGMLEKTLWEWANEKSAIRDAEWKQSQTWWLTNSENHHAAHIAACWSSARVLRDVTGYRDKPFKDGRSPAEHYAAWTQYLKEYFRQRACKGTFVEIDSPSYATVVLQCMVDCHDFSDDPVLKQRAAQLLDLYWALWAEEQIDGVSGGAQARCYPEHAVRCGCFLRNAAWYVLGIGEQGLYHSGMIPFVTTTWEAPEVVLRIVACRAAGEPYAIRERRMGLTEKGYDQPPNYRLRSDFGGILRYTYCTPEFIMGTLITEARPTSDWAAISSKDRWSGVVFAGNPDARVFPTPYNAGSSILNGFWSVQSQGAMISQRLPGAAVDESGRGKRDTAGWRVFFSTAGLSKPLQSGPWTFAEAKAAYVGVRVVDGDTSIAPDRWGSWLVCKNSLTPVIIEAGRKADYASFAAFQTAALAQPITFEQAVLKYTALGGDKLTFYADHSRLPEINGTVVNLAPEKVYDSPFVQSRWNSGLVTIQCGEEKRLLNFNE